MDNLREKGSALKKAREAQGISLETVHENTKIPLDALRALEEGYTVRTLSPFYQKGFLKIYAQYLGCDVGDVLNDFQPKEVLDSNSKGIYPSAAQKSFLYKEKNQPRKPPRNFSLPLGEARINFFKKIQAFFKSERLALAGKFIGILLVMFILFKFVSAVSHKLFSKDKKAATKTSAVSKKTAKEIPFPKSNPSTQPSTVTFDASGEENLKNVMLSIRAQKNTWLQVKVDGSTVFESILKKGVAETWIAQKEIELSGKNINQLEFEVNGKMIGSLGREDSQTKKVVITKNGLSVKK